MQHWKLTLRERVFLLTMWFMVDLPRYSDLLGQASG